MYRQGDVLIVVATTVPRSARRMDHCVIALGEATGHTHRVEVGAEQLVGEDGIQYLRVLGASADVIHEEHATITLPGPAVYRIVHQREYAPAAPRRMVAVND